MENRLEILGDARLAKAYAMGFADALATDEESSRMVIHLDYATREEIRELTEDIQHLMNTKYRQISERMKRRTS